MWIRGAAAVVCVGLAFGCTRRGEQGPSEAGSDASSQDAAVGSDEALAFTGTFASRPMLAHSCTFVGDAPAELTNLPESFLPFVHQNAAFVMGETADGWSVRRYNGTMGAGGCVLVTQLGFGENGVLKLGDSPLDLAVVGSRLLVLGQEPMMYSLEGEAVEACPSLKNLTRLSVAGERAIARHGDGTLVEVSVGDRTCETTPAWRSERWKATGLVATNRSGVTAFIVQDAAGVAALAIWDGTATRYFTSQETDVSLVQVTGLSAVGDDFILTQAVAQRMQQITSKGERVAMTQVRDVDGMDRFFIPMRIASSPTSATVASGWRLVEGEKQGLIYGLEPVH